MLKRRKRLLSLSKETLVALHPIAGEDTVAAGTAGTSADMTCNTTLCTQPGFGCGSGQPCVPTGGRHCTF